MRFLWPALLLITGCSGGPEVAPGKIVSNNPCVDAILAKIADPAQIGAVSAWSHDVNSASAPVAWARRFPAIGADAESLIATRPKLALIGSFGNATPLDRAGIKHLAYGVPASVSESRIQVRDVARAIGRIAEGEQLVTAIDMATKQKPARRSAIIWLSGGFVPGQGTLQDELLARAGFRNASASYGLKQWDVLPLETMLRHPPDVIFTPLANKSDRALLLRHRVLARMDPKPQIIAFPEKLLNCGGPSIVAAMAILGRAS
jgi:iron complex transport system substrate-binding protein